MIQVMIIEDNADLRERLNQLMEFSPKLNCLIAIDSMEVFFRLPYQKKSPDIVLLDIGLPGMSGLEGIPRIKEKFPDAEIVILTASNAPDKIFKAICLGASGYLLKDINFDYLESNLVLIHEKKGAALSPQVARRVLNYFQKARIQKKPDNIKLKDKEYIIVRSLVDGLSYQETADALKLTIDGIRYHIKNIYKKLQISSKSQLVKKYMDGEIDME